MGVCMIMLDDFGTDIDELLKDFPPIGIDTLLADFDTDLENIDLDFDMSLDDLVFDID